MVVVVVGVGVTGAVVGGGGPGRSGRSPRRGGRLARALCEGRRQTIALGLRPGIALSFLICDGGLPCAFAHPPKQKGRPEKVEEESRFSPLNSGYSRNIE